MIELGPTLTNSPVAGLSPMGMSLSSIQELRMSTSMYFPLSQSLTSSVELVALMVYLFLLRSKISGSVKFGEWTGESGFSE